MGLALKVPGPLFRVDILQLCGAHIRTRVSVTSAEAKNFARYAHRFSENISERNNNARKVFLLLDEHRSQISVRAVDVLRAGNVIA